MGVCSRQFDIVLSDDGGVVESVLITGGLWGRICRLLLAKINFFVYL